MCILAFDVNRNSSWRWLDHRISDAWCKRAQRWLSTSHWKASYLARTGIARTDTASSMTDNCWRADPAQSPGNDTHFSRRISLLFSPPRNHSIRCGGPGRSGWYTGWMRSFCRGEPPGCWALSRADTLPGSAQGSSSRSPRSAARLFVVWSGLLILKFQKY